MKNPGVVSRGLSLMETPPIAETAWGQPGESESEALTAVTPVVPKVVVATVTAALMIRNRWSAIYTRCGRRDSVEAHSALLWTAFFGAA
jgi:hypothetical protein